MDKLITSVMDWQLLKYMNVFSTADMHSCFYSRKLESSRMTGCASRI